MLMSDYTVSKSVPIQVTRTIPRLDALDATPLVETWGLAVNANKTLMGLMVPSELRLPADLQRMTHMAYYVDNTMPLRWLAEHEPDALWYFDAGTTMPAITATYADLLAASIELGILVPPFTITRANAPFTFVQDDDLRKVIEMADADLKTFDEVILSDSSGKSIPGRIGDDE